MSPIRIAWLGMFLGLSSYSSPLLAFASAHILVDGKLTPLPYGWPKELLDAVNNPALESAWFANFSDLCHYGGKVEHLNAMLVALHQLKLEPGRLTVELGGAACELRNPFERKSNSHWRVTVRSSRKWLSVHVGIRVSESLKLDSIQVPVGIPITLCLAPIRRAVTAEEKVRFTAWLRRREQAEKERSPR